MPVVRAAICRTGHPVDKDDRGPVRDEIVGGNGDIQYRHLLIRLLEMLVSLAWMSRIR